MADRGAGPTTTTAGVAPWLVLSVGNPSRGDDGLGPELARRLAAEEHGAGDIEFLTDFQLQVEHALDLAQRRAVLFVDAALPGAIDACAPHDRTSDRASEPATGGAAIAPIAPCDGVPPASHALAAGAVLHVARRVAMDVPPAWQLAIEGASFGLGEGLSAVAERHLERALALTRDWLEDRRRDEGRVACTS